MSRMPAQIENYQGQSQPLPSHIPSHVQMVPLRENNQQAQNPPQMHQPPQTKPSNFQPNMVPLGNAYQNNSQTSRVITGPFTMPPGKNCQQCQCILPEDTLRMKQQIIRLQNALMQEKDKSARTRLMLTDQNNKRTRELEDYIDRLHEEGSVRQLVQEVEELKEKEKNSFQCLEQLAAQNSKLTHQYHKLEGRFQDYKEKSKFLGQSRVPSSASRWGLNTEGDSLLDFPSESLKSSSSYLRKLEQSNTWLQRENKRLTSIISQGMRAR